MKIIPVKSKQTMLFEDCLMAEEESGISCLIRRSVKSASMLDKSSSLNPISLSYELHAAGLGSYVTRRRPQLQLFDALSGIKICS